jgi:hypothetical protein
MKIILLIIIGLSSFHIRAGDLMFKNGFENSALVAGNVTGLDSNGLSLMLSFNSTVQTLVIITNGSFVFTPEVPLGASWSVAIQSQPTNPCSLSNNSGTMTAAGVSNVQVSCTDSINNWDMMKWDEGSWN